MAVRSFPNGCVPTNTERGMAEPYILHMISPLKHVSPFDANMALDAGFDTVVPYAHVEVAEVRALVQDAICAFEGANVTLVGHDGPERVRRAADEIKKRFGLEVGFADGSTDLHKAD